MATCVTVAGIPPEKSGKLDLEAVRARAKRCEACPLYRLGTQTVFGEGPGRARILMVGEQPGDQEDRAGRPFVGPAGQLLDRALVGAGIARDDVYVTNVVKHFKWKPMGKRRLHQKPSAREIAACRPWLDAELELIHPIAVIALGATAAQALMGREFRVTRSRGQPLDVPWAKVFFATVHPSSILRGPPEDRARGFAELQADLKKAAEHPALRGSTARRARNQGQARGQVSPKG